MPTVGTPKHGEGFLRGERGTAMVVALVMLSLLSILGLSAISSTVFTLRTSANYRQSVDALLIAEAGLEHAKSVLRSLPFKQALAGPDGNPATLGDNGIIFASETVAFRNGAYTVRVTDNDDGDNDPSRDRDQRVIITSTGKLNDSSARKVITALVSKANLATPPAAVSVLDAQYELDFRGNSFTIEGKDRNPDGSAGPEPAINGMAVEAPQPSAAEIDGFFDAQAAKNNITGSGGASPDIAFGDTPLQLDEVRQTRERLIQMANVRYSGSTDLSSTTLGTLENPRITYVNDSLRLSGGVTGYGVLIVDKDLVITGNVNFYGIVIVGVCPTCPGRVEQGAGNFNLYGSLLVANTTSEFSAEARIKVTGNGDFFYSSSAINNALSATFATERWREVPGS